MSIKNGPNAIHTCSSKLDCRFTQSDQELQHQLIGQWYPVLHLSNVAPDQTEWMYMKIVQLQINQSETRNFFAVRQIVQCCVVLIQHTSMNNINTHNAVK